VSVDDIHSSGEQALREHALGEVTWRDIEDLGLLLAGGLPSACGEPSFDRIVGVSRGGLVPAVLLASHLGVKRLETVQVRLYEANRKLDAPVVLGALPGQAGPSGTPSRTLIVDEMVDSGTTLRHLAGLFPRAHLAALVARTQEAPDAPVHGLHALALATPGGERPVWVARCLPTDRWILFPWSPAEDRQAAGEAP